MPPRRENIPQFDDKRPAVVSPKSIAIPLWFSWAMTVTFVGATVWLMGQLYTINAKLDDRWTPRDQRQWAHQLQQQNKSLMVPEPDEIYGRRP